VRCICIVHILATSETEIESEDHPEVRHITVDVICCVKRLLQVVNDVEGHRHSGMRALTLVENTCWFSGCKSSEPHGLVVEGRDIAERFD
jgi:hypothetical protein